MDGPLCPSRYQINTRVWLTELSHALGRPATLDDKRLYDRLRAGHARPVRQHLHAGLDYRRL
jgi:hypothetical protein